MVDLQTHEAFFIWSNGRSAACQDFSLIEEVIVNLLDDIMKNLLTVTPSIEEISSYFFNLSKDSSPGLDGFGGVFYQTYWNIVKHDVYKELSEFFTSGWIFPNFNSNTIILLSKSKDDNTVEKFRPIAMANFKFKIISKILANKSGFSSKKFHWISTILFSANLYLEINGSHHGYFKCVRGVRLWDPLSPSLFCLVEEVLTRGISKLVSVGNLKPMMAIRTLGVPIHILYVNDILIFRKGTASNIQALASLFSSLGI
ncbi:uncharacterized protein LOC131605530 [Vicia villosa]|uniref:uncharacterized protein LOC131605530 n=1 Tax=Vicia villosa TaxID=3911 RepID=UPI00273A83AC|nr:uncharacterized protein LOC131605530 [Vicia villosa]